MLLLQLHALATLALAGLIWTVQLVHYPLLAEVRQGFVRYHERHCARIAWLVGPLMGTEAVTAVLLALAPPPGVGLLQARVGLGLVVLLWLTTAFVSVPLHDRLGRGYDAAAIRSLVRSNWIRTLGWTARAGLVLGMLAPAG